MATTVAQPGTTLRKVAKEYASQANMPVDQFLDRLKRLNPDYNKGSGSEALRLGKGVKGSEQSNAGDQPPATNAPQFNVANILESPLYTQNLQDYYLSTYLPGLTESTFNINQARTELGANEANRARQRGEAIKRVAGSYAARGMRSPAAVNRDRSEIQSEFANLSRAEQNQLQGLINQRDVMFGAGAQNKETFLTDPTLFGSIGAGARRESLSNLQSLPELYNLLGLGASTAPLMQSEPAAVSAASAPSTKPKSSAKPKATAPKATTPKYIAPKAQPASKAAVIASEARRDAAMAARAPKPAPVRKK
jgi:hypothetical protein